MATVLSDNSDSVCSFSLLFIYLFIIYYKAGCKPSVQSNGFITEDIGGRISICDRLAVFCRGGGEGAKHEVEPTVLS